MKKALVIGDVILDEYVHLSTERQCSEAPLPVWDIKKTVYHLGGAANVAINLMNLGDDIEVHIAGMCGPTSYYKLKSLNLSCDLLQKVIPGQEIIKTRYVKEPITSLHDSMVARVDNRKTFLEFDCQQFEKYLLSKLENHDFDLIIISDYRMGTITENVAQKICQNPSCVVVVDSKRKNLSMFRGASVLKLNELEYDVQLLMRDYNVNSLANFCIVTKGAKGATVNVYEPAKKQINQSHPMYMLTSMDFPVPKVPVVDVTGCGDVFTAALGYYMTTKLNDVFSATKFANVCATVAVQKLGTGI